MKAFAAWQNLIKGHALTLLFGEGSAAVTVRSIPGLKYELRRCETLDAESAVSSQPSYQVAAYEVATGARVTLIDFEPTKGQAFYRVVVSVPFRR